MKPLVIEPGARTELFAAADFYEGCCPGLGRVFTDSIEKAFADIRARPLSFPAYKATGVRRCLAHRFPYLIFYLVRREDVWVVAVAHASREPDYWKNRLSTSP